MKFSFSLKNKEASMEADVEGIVEKSLEYKTKQAPKKTRYQIKQEEKRKTEEMKHKQQMQYLFILLGLCGVFLVVGIVASILGI